SSFVADELHESLGGHGLGSLDGESQGAVPDERGKDAERPRHSEQHGVVLHLLHAVVLREKKGGGAMPSDSRVGVHVGPGVLDLAELEQDRGHHAVDLAHQLEHGVIGQVLEGKLSLARVAGVRLAQHRMATLATHLPRLEGLPDKVLELLLVHFSSELLLQLCQPYQHFLKKKDCTYLVGQAVKGSSQAVHSCGQGQVWVRKGTAHQVGRVGTHVATLVVTVGEGGGRSSLPVDGEIQPHELGEGRVVVAEHGGEVRRPVLGHVDGPDAAALAEQVAVDGGRNRRELGHQGHRVIEIGSLGGALVVRLDKLALGVAGRDGGAQLGHGVHVGREVVQHRHHVRGEVRLLCPRLGHRLHLHAPPGEGCPDLFGGGDVPGEEQPEEALWQGLFPSLRLGQQLADLRDGVTPEGNAFLRVQVGRLRHQALDATHAAIDLRTTCDNGEPHLVNGDFSDHLAATLLPELLHLGLRRLDLVGHEPLEV
ncbi:unnamed protein product, partial [Ixodes persulcatus]